MQEDWKSEQRRTSALFSAPPALVSPDIKFMFGGRFTYQPAVAHNQSANDSMVTREDIIAKQIVDALDVRLGAMESRLTQRLDSTCEQCVSMCDRLDTMCDRLDAVCDRIDTTILPQLDAVHAMMSRRPYDYRLN